MKKLHSELNTLKKWFSDNIKTDFVDKLSNCITEETCEKFNRIKEIEEIINPVSFERFENLFNVKQVLIKFIDGKWNLYILNNDGEDIQFNWRNSRYQYDRFMLANWRAHELAKLHGNARVNLER